MARVPPEQCWIDLMSPPQMSAYLDALKFGPDVIQCGLRQTLRTYECLAKKCKNTSCLQQQFYHQWIRPWLHGICFPRGIVVLAC